MNGYPPGFLERHMPGLRTPQSRAHQREALLRAASALDPNAMDMACSRGAPMETGVVEAMVKASERGHFHPARMLECIRCCVRWNADLLRPGPNGTSAAIALLQSIQHNSGAFNQAVRLVERRCHGGQTRVEGRVMRFSEALALINPDNPEVSPDAVGDAGKPASTPKP